MNDLEQLRAAVAREIPRAKDDLTKLVAIPSISFIPEHASDVDAAAEFVAGLIRDLGWDDVKIVAEGGKPAVIAHYPAPQGAPTIVLYSHMDVQPTGAAEEWTSAPFTVDERDGRIYGRGVCDDKGGVIAHVTALRALGGKPPVGVTLFFEGEEESGSPSMGNLLAKYGDELKGDAFVLLDSGNWGVGKPAFTASLRGLVDTVVEVRTLDHALHSGQFGGSVPDAVTTLCRLLATLWTDDGSVAVEGLHVAKVADLEYPDEQLRAESGVLDGVELIGHGTLVERLWGQPAITVIGIDAPPVAQASNTLVPVARAKVSMRIAPGQDAATALELLKKHLVDHAPFGAQVTCDAGGAGSGAALDLTGPIATTYRQSLTDAFGVDPVDMGMGGSIPLANELSEKYPQAEVLLTGIVDPDSRMHGIDESLDLADWQNAALAEALLLARMAPQA